MLIQPKTGVPAVKLGHPVERKTYSIPEGAAVLGIGKSRAYEMARSGELPGVLKVGNRYLISRKVLDAFVDGELQETGPAA